MSLFGSLGKTAASEREEIPGLAQFSYKSLVDKDEIGEGGFAVIFTARLSSSDSAKIVVKKLLASDKVSLANGADETFKMIFRS